MSGAKAAKRHLVEASLLVADDVAAGRLDPASVEAAVVEECRALFGAVDGPGDALWELQVEVARQVLAVGGGIGADELSEWVAVYRAAEGRPPEQSWIERALADGADEGDDAGDDDDAG
ncbi:flagellar hook-length control protein [Mycolicibacterium sp.]|uniref:flagellar hook-length control protein n=1 Tax=Mycolicibacterium sp. TaxID=2320850 RepID=UPI00355E61F0